MYTSYGVHNVHCTHGDIFSGRQRSCWWFTPTICRFAECRPYIKWDERRFVCGTWSWMRASSPREGPQVIVVQKENYSTWRADTRKRANCRMTAGQLEVGKVERTSHLKVHSIYLRASAGSVPVAMSHSVLGLESVHIQVPVAVLVGTSATLICECDLPDEDLYSVKWYKGKHEFFRYTSKEIPSIKIFPKAGISVNVNLSNASHLVLVNLEPQSTGKYSCEITEAAPSFHTKIATRTMNVVDLPTGEPQIVDMKSYYGAEEFLEVECRAGPSLPAPKLEWYVNDLPLRQPLQVPSRLEYSTHPALSGSATSYASPSNSKPSRSSRKKQSAKSSLPQHAPTVPTSTELESRENDLEEMGPGASTNRPLPAVVSTTQEPTANSSTSGEHRKGAANSRYELSVSRLKLLLEHGHFRNGKLKRHLPSMAVCRKRNRMPLYMVQDFAVVGMAEK
uniref:Ig-like domain-containing protein n=1 Tax=Anopheles minimus TaxID=112268 RepID=A0A182W4K7_9DIPT